MKNILISIFTMALSFGQIDAQDAFVKRYGDFSGQGNCVIADGQGNYLLVGSKFYLSSTKKQFYMQKIDQNGTSVWLKYYGGPLDDAANEIIATNDGGYALIGTTVFSNTTSYITFIKLTNSGDSSWAKTYGGLNSEIGTSIIQTTLGNYFIGGSCGDYFNYKSDFYLIKTNSNGDTIWTKKYGGIQNERLNSIAQCSDGGIVMAGYTESFGAGSRDFYLIKVDANGSVQWSKTYGDALMDVANSVKQTPDGGFILAGYSHYGATSSDIFIVKTNSTGDTLWTRTFTQPTKAMTANDVIVTKDGGYAITGTTDIWQITPPNTTSYVRGDARLMKLTSNGFVQGIKEYPVGPTNQCLTTAYGNSIIQLADESCVVGGTFFNCSTFETMLIKTFDIGPTTIRESEGSILHIFPNPSKDKVTFQLGANSELHSLTLFNITGKKVYEIKDHLSKQITIEKGNLICGIYYFQIGDNAGRYYSGKIVFE